MINRPFLSQVSGIISALLVIVLVVMGIVFVYMYGRRNPGGLSERIAMRLEANYKRFGGPNDDSVELEHTKKEQQINNNNNNNNNQQESSTFLPSASSTSYCGLEDLLHSLDASFD